MMGSHPIIVRGLVHVLLQAFLQERSSLGPIEHLYGLLGRWIVIALVCRVGMVPGDGDADGS